MLRHRQELDVSEAEVGHVVGDGVGQLAVAQETTVLPGDTPPGTEMQLVDRPGAAERVDSRATLHPLLILPLIGELPDHGCGARWQFGAKRVRVALVDGVAAMARDDMVLVERAWAYTLHL